MKTITILTLLCGLLMALTGCGEKLERAEDTNSFAITAEPLCEEAPNTIFAADFVTSSDGTQDSASTDPGHCESQTDPTTGVKNALGDVAVESEGKCARFLNHLLIAADSTDAGLDGLTTLFAAVGSVVQPLAVVHAFTASAAVSSGWKSTIDSDVFAKETIANYAQVIQTTYATDMKTYLDQLSASDESGLVYSIGVSKIVSIHRECSLVAAQASISASLKSNAAPTAGSESETVTVTKGASKDDYEIDGSNTAAGLALSVSYPNTGQDVRTVVSELVLKVLGAPDFQAAGVTANLDSADATTFTLHSPAGISWSVKGNLSLAAGGGNGAGGAAPQASGGDLTQAAVAGHAVNQ